ncbi:melanoregulin-like, partial [Amblyraja radiata]|uniref:melanoregulin-like n=1 Tax=Amblyraja radiata TaxID=386614 RepID=UPI0014041A89
MGDWTPMRWVCCSCCDGEETEEKIPIISNETLMYFANEAQRRSSELPNMWSEIRAVSLQERDDEEVRNLLHRRAKTRRGSQGYRRLSLDIQSALQEREDVLDKWKFILESLGFGAEAVAMLTVTTSSSYSSLRNTLEAERLLDILAQESNIFDKRMPAERYIYVL